MGFRIRVRFSGQNFWMILLMQSSQRGMKESRLDEVAREMVVGRMMGPTTSYMMFLQSKGSGVVVKKSSFPWGRSSYMSLRRGNRRSSGGGSFKWRFSSKRLGRVCGDARKRHSM